MGTLQGRPLRLISRIDLTGGYLYELRYYPCGNVTAGIVLGCDHGHMIRRLQGKQPRLGCAIARKTFIAIEMVRSDVEQYRHVGVRSEEHTSELQSLMRNSYAVFCLTKKKNNKYNTT